MSGFFSNNSTGVMSSTEADALQKALTAGYGTDSSQFTGGRTLIPENLESEVINVLTEQKEECKMMNSMKKTPVKSVVHEVNLRSDYGDWKHLSVAEGGSSIATDQSLNRKTFNMKYLQTRRSVTKQMEAVESFENALASEKIAGVETVLRGAEYQCFHGNSDVIPTEFDGFLASINKAKKTTIKDLRGSTLASYGGEKLFDEMAQLVYQKGGWVEKALFPPVLAKEIKEIFEEKARYVMNLTGTSMDSMYRGGIPNYESAIGASIALSGNDCGADKFFQVKGEVLAEGDTALRPVKPGEVNALASSESVDASQFTEDGTYKYRVHAINEYGISEGKESEADVIVGKGCSVTLKITAGDGIKPTGYIICRSANGGSDVYEMTQIAADDSGTTEFTDLNEDLPGTASMILLPKLRQNYYSFGQLLPTCTFPLYANDKAETPFLVLLFGALELRTPEYCALIKNISYSGGVNY